MELLTPLLEYVMHHPLPENDAVKLGSDICKALELCKLHNSVHRDIKPGNIFVSELGDFKLGDFGIARTVEKTTGGLSKKGTAPEVYKEEPYNASVDLYSLGIVLYRFLNNNRTPLLPLAPQPITFRDRENAQFRRMSGEVIPPPKLATEALSRVVLKTCAFQPENRYSDPGQMRYDLEHTTVSVPSSVAPDPILSAPIEPAVKQFTDSEYQENTGCTVSHTETSHFHETQMERTVLEGFPVKQFEYMYKQEATTYTSPHVETLCFEDDLKEGTVVEKATTSAKSNTEVVGRRSKSNLPLGIVGALLGCFLSWFVWLLLEQVKAIGPFSGIGGAATAFFVLSGYGIMGKAIDKKGLVACSAIIVYSVKLLFRTSVVISMVLHAYNQLDWKIIKYYWLSFERCFRYYYGESQMPLYFALAYLFTVMGAYLYFL